MIHLVLGGARSGKSALAEAVTGAQAGPLLYVATGWAEPGDDDMAARIERHRADRDPRFRTVEVGRDLVDLLPTLPDHPALVDALGTWVAAHDDLEVDVAGLCRALAGRSALTVVVSEEVGLGVHPETPVGRRFRDVLGEVNQAVAAIAGRVTLVVAGRALDLPAAPVGDGA